MKPLILLLFISAIPFDQKDGNTIPTSGEPKIVINHEMINRFNEATFDSTKNFNYILSIYLESVKPEN